MRLWKYIKAAFGNRWNLLALAGGIGMGVLSGYADVVIPLVMAAEIGWLGLIGTHPKFQSYVDAQEHKLERAANAAGADQRLRRMLHNLPRNSQTRFHELRKRCDELRVISKQMHLVSDGRDVLSMSGTQLDGLDQLLWLFLKLLFSEQSLHRFFETTSRDRIEQEISEISARLQRETQRPEHEQRARIIATLEDNLQTSQNRLKNFIQARDSYDLVKAEQQRLESKIRSLAEMGISRGDPQVLSDEVDNVAGSVDEAQKTLSSLQFVTGFDKQYEEVPEIVSRDMLRSLN